MKAETQIIELPIESLQRAEWNYKTDGTVEQIEKLKQSIIIDKSAGVIAVREISAEKFEVIDGNHRLRAVQELGWTVVPCENFGNISLGRAVTIARRRNNLWFEDDTLKFAQLFKDAVLPEFDLDTLQKFMPETREELESISKLLDFDWNQFNKPKNGDGDKFNKVVKLELSEETYNVWLKWLERAKNLLGYDNPSKAFEFAIIEAMNIPEESLKQ